MPDIIFPGPDGRLEGRYTHGPEANAPIALILHPHPLYGGTMNNKVTYNLFHVFAKRGFSVLRFNFRGVGRSQGTFDNGQGELSDAFPAYSAVRERVIPGPLRAARAAASALNACARASATAGFEWRATAKRLRRSHDVDVQWAEGAIRSISALAVAGSSDLAA